MKLPVREQLKYWGIGALVLIVLLWFLGNVLLPFVLGAAIAYLLDPVADRLERAGASRGLATAIITIGAVLLFILIAVLVIPTLFRQTTQLIQVAPELFQNVQGWLSQQFPQVQFDDEAFREAMTNLGEALRSRAGELIQTALTSAASFVSILLLFVIVPVVAVYLLMDWDRMVARIDELLPRQHAPTIRQLARDIDHTLAGFIRGMGTVCVILGTYYAVALMVVGLQFGLVVGVIAGLLTFIPYVGAIVGGALAIGLALFQFWGDWIWIIAVAVIFQIGQVIEGNVLTPKLVGDSVGLHPVWLLLAMSVFGTLFGFVGLLVAVPVAAALGVVMRFLVAQYKSSRLYTGSSGGGGDGTA
ncbi:membrane protein [Roseivivax halodurans JCM 10272]|uniref:Membrane protein n=1 Tax=Roseivivax halodurans JCM 10272 TaxID=1449350 RepID=X7EL40_9RHOB|nr:AI-2E family transporter [Roseivivax halodurans]ETX16642.1 membrane protein [Roseivivax halodurans JCM 10272]